MPLTTRIRRRSGTPGAGAQAEWSLNILQPNYYYAFREYFDDYTHRTVYSHISICDFLEVHDYRVTRCVPRFRCSPSNHASGSPRFLIGLYLLSPMDGHGKADADTGQAGRSADRKRRY
jgi:hypothetical protein